MTNTELPTSTEPRPGGCLRLLRTVGLIVVGVIVALIVLAYVIPVPPLEDTVPAASLADEDSRFMEVNDVLVHFKLTGEGDPPVILLHGFAASTFTWRDVMPPLAEERLVVAYDRPAFGLTERPDPREIDGPNPYAREAQAALVVGLMDAMGIDKAILMGHSAGGAVALDAALAYPDRVAGLVLVDAAVYTQGGLPAFLQPILRTAPFRRIGPLVGRSFKRIGRNLAEQSWEDPAKLTPEILEGYMRSLEVDGWDRALWELVLVTTPQNLPDRLDEVGMPVLVVTGDNDRVVPTEDSVRLADELPNAELVVIAEAGHVPHEDQPEAFLEAVQGFLAGLE
jgi:pimeloyl-ACP methyl ester carboxylesterase